MSYPVIDTQLSPEGLLEVLSKSEVSKLRDNSQGAAFEAFEFSGITWLNYRGSPPGAS